MSTELNAAKAPSLRSRAGGRSGLWSRVVRWLNDDSPRLVRQQLLVAFVLYGLVALAAYWPVYPGDTASVPTEPVADVVDCIWFLKFTQYALFHGHNLFVTPLYNAPFGVNIAQNTAMPLLGIATAWLTDLVSPVASYNLLMWLAFPLSALSVAFVLRRWGIWFPGALFGGLLYGFGPYVAGQGYVHLNLSFVPLPPLIVLAAFELFALSNRPLYWGTWLGVLLVFQFYVSPEVLSTTVLMTAIGLVILGGARWRSVVARVRMVLRGLGVALVIFLGCTVVAIWYSLAGPGHFSGPIQGYYNPFHADLLGAVIPTSGQLLYPAAWKAAGDKLVIGIWYENGSYLGIPLIILWLSLTWSYRRNRWLLFSASMVAVSYVVSLGALLTVDARATTVRLPFYWLSRFPVLEDVLTCRMSVYTMLAIAISVAIGLDEWRRRSVVPRVARSKGSRVSTGLVAAGVIATVMSLLPDWPYPSVSTGVPPSLLSWPARLIPTGATVLAYPYPTPGTNEAMLWQALDNMRYKLLGGYGLTASYAGTAMINPAALAPESVQAIFTYYAGGYAWDVIKTPRLQSFPVQLMREFLEFNDVGAIIVDRRIENGDRVGDVIEKAVGRPRYRDASVEIWTRQGGKTAAW